MRQDIAARFARETAQHEMTIAHDDGLYRHLQFRKTWWQPPYARQQRTAIYRFDLITVPGSLIFQGDGESFVFSRVEDMFEFFRGPVGRINAMYWAEKLTSHRDAATTYSRDRFFEHLRDDFVEACRERRVPAGTGRAIREAIEMDYNVDCEEDARRFLDLFEFEGFRFVDTFEWHLDDYDWWFLWSLHAIVWGIAQYDAATSEPCPGHQRAS